MMPSATGGTARLYQKPNLMGWSNLELSAFKTVLNKLLFFTNYTASGIIL
jgi:hypothetical protein